MSDDLFNKPSDLPTGGLKIADLEGCLVVVQPDAEEVKMSTSIGEGTARPAQVLVLDGDLASDSWQPALLFGAGLKAQAGAAHRSGRPIVGVVGKGEAKAGKTAPWLFKDPTDKQLEAARRAYMAAAPF